VIVIRPTAKLRTRLKCDLVQSPPVSTGLLGDWYANLVRVERRQLLIAVSVKTLLPVVLEARDARSLPERLPLALGEVLAALEIPAPAIALEQSHMREHAYAKTLDRRVLGSMTDYGRLIDAYLEPGRSLVDVALNLAEAPMSAIKMNSPERETRAIFGCPKTAVHSRQLTVESLVTPKPQAVDCRPSTVNARHSRVLPFLSTVSEPLGSKFSRADRERVAAKLMEAETAYYDALRRHRDERSDDSRIALADAERVLKALEDWAAQVSREEVFH
jgi:hypothetical protein